MEPMGNTTTNHGNQKNNPPTTTIKIPPPPTLYHLITRRQWSSALTRLQKHPSESTYQDANGYTILHRLITRITSTDPPPPLSLLQSLLIIHPPATILRTVKDKRTPLHLACYNNHIPLDQIRLIATSRPAACVMKDVYGWCPLHIVTRFNAPMEVIRVLVECHPPALYVVDDEKGRIPLHIACGFFGVGSMEQLRLFLGSNGHLARRLCEFEDLEGWTPLEVLCQEHEGGMTRAMTMIALRGCREEGDGDDDDVSNLFVDGGLFWKKANLLVRVAYHGTVDDDDGDNDTGSSSSTLIHMCIGLGDHCPAIFTRLVLQIYPHQVKQRDGDGNLPLHLAASLGSSTDGREDIRTLICLYPEAAAMRNNDGQRPLDLAQECRMSWKDGFRTLLYAYPLAIESIKVSDELFPFVLERLVEDKNFPVLYQLLKERPTIFKLACDDNINKSGLD